MGRTAARAGLRRPHRLRTTARLQGPQRESPASSRPRPYSPIAATATYVGASPYSFVYPTRYTRSGPATTGEYLPSGKLQTGFPVLTSRPYVRPFRVEK